MFFTIPAKLSVAFDSSSFKRLRINQKETDNLKISILNYAICCNEIQNNHNVTKIFSKILPYINLKLESNFIVHKNYIYENYNKIPS